MTRDSDLNHAIAVLAEQGITIDLDEAERRRFLRMPGRVDTLQRRIAMFAVAREEQPLTVRRVYYRMTTDWQLLPIDGASSPGDPTGERSARQRKSYRRVSEDLTHLRECGVVPDEWVVDGIRGMERVPVHPDLSAFLQSLRYCRDPWVGQRCMPIVFTEKDACSGILDPIVVQYRVPIIVTRGFDSRTNSVDSANLMRGWIGQGWVPVGLYAGDCDPSGIEIEMCMRRFLDAAGLANRYEWQRIAVTRDDYDSGNYPSFPIKGRDGRAKKYQEQGFDHCVELDAIPAPELRQRLGDALDPLIDDHEAWSQSWELEAAERQALARIAVAA